jgi:hypothetical protein
MARVPHAFGGVVFRAAIRAGDDVRVFLDCSLVFFFFFFFFVLFGSFFVCGCCGLFALCDSYVVCCLGSVCAEERIRIRFK